MSFTHRIYFSFIILLICSTIITIAGIRGFLKLEPYINTLNSHNTQSLHYAEQMLSSISTKKDLKTFEQNLKNAKSR